MRVLINNKTFYNEYTVAGTYRYLTFFFPVKSGDKIVIQRNNAKLYINQCDIR